MASQHSYKWLDHLHILYVFYSFVFVIYYYKNKIKNIYTFDERRVKLAIIIFINFTKFLAKLAEV